MIEKVVLDFLNASLDVPVYMEVPEDKPNRYVLLEKTGSGRRDHILSATIAVQSIAESMYQAALLNEQAKEVMDRLIELPVIGRAALSTDYNFTDPETKEYRYQAVYDLIYMED